ncbi:MAG TPA: ABC transporter permease, partial [Candidatus Limnocylindrales bacterium]|nr:ABC transporter permease [Candidatus Limnocylindrales bacterium]
MSDMPVVPTAPPRTTIIRPPSRWGAFELGELWAYRDLLAILSERNLKLRYKQTALGVIWVVLQPLIAALIFAVIFGGFAQLPTDGSPYLLFAFAGTLIWNLVSNSISRAGNSLVGDVNLISKVYFPRMIIPAASIIAVVVDFLIGLVVLAVLLIVYGQPITPALLTLPLIVAVALVLALGTSLLISALNVYYRDFSYILPFLLQVWMYASPVAYSASIVPDQWQTLYALNPMVGVILGFRWAVLGEIAFPAFPLLVSIIAAVAFLIIGALVFQRVQQ